MVQVSFEVGVTGAYKAAKRKDICIVVDVLRASSTIVAAFAGGISRIVPTTDAMHNDNAIARAGEYQGGKIPEFDYCNSPVELLNNHHKGQKIILLTTNGVPCIKACATYINAIVLIGSLLNCRAVGKLAYAYAQQTQKSISFIMAGYHNELEMDDWVASSMIYNESLSMLPVTSKIKPLTEINNILSLLKESPAALRLNSAGYDKDIDFCAKLNFTNIVPRYSYEENEIYPLEESSNDNA